MPPKQHHTRLLFSYIIQYPRQLSIGEKPACFYRGLAHDLPHVIYIFLSGSRVDDVALLFISFCLLVVVDYRSESLLGVQLGMEKLMTESVRH